MVKYSCETCQKTFSQRGHEDHLNSPCKKDTIEALIEQKVKEVLSKTDETIETKESIDSKKTRKELIAICKEKNIKGYSGKKKNEILKLLSTDTTDTTDITNINDVEKIYRLNYIGSKFKLLEWITDNMKEKTGWSSFANKIIGDLFAGTGIVSYHFRKNMARVISNDAELYSSIITHAFTRSLYTDNCKKIIDLLQLDIQENKHSTTNGFITTHYSPQGSNERKFFTIENAKRIDYIRNKLETIKDISEDEYKFILASILISADAVSNVPAVYGCFLKNF